MNTRQPITVVLVLVISLVVSGCGPGQMFGPAMTPTSTPPPASTPTPTPFPTSTSIPTPTPDPLSQIDLSTIALQASDLQLAENITRTEKGPGAEEQGVINFYNETFNWSGTVNTVINVIRVFENEALLSEFFQKDTRNTNPDEQFSIPLLGNKYIAEVTSAGGLNAVIIAWRYNETYVFLMYTSTTSDRGHLMAETTRLAQQIDTRLKMSILSTPDPGYATTLVGGGHEQIVFSSNRDGMGDIYMMNSDGLNVVRLSHDSAGDKFPAFSPDGQHIAYYFSGGIYVMNADGTNPSLIADGGIMSSWSPDGTQIAYHNYDRNTKKSYIYITNADGTNQRKLTEGLSPSWSPDGNYIVFTRYQDTNGTVSFIYRIKPDGSDLVQLTKDQVDFLDPFWSPDGKTIIFNDLHDIYLMNPDGSNRVNLTNGSFQGSLEHAVWSTDESHIIFSSDHQIYILNADGSNATRLSDFNVHDDDPAWRP
jgi:Tol biopolymer transport system component